MLCATKNLWDSSTFLIYLIIRYDQAVLARRLTRDIGDIKNHIACSMKEEPKLMEIMDDLTTKEKGMENYKKVADNIDAKSITENVTVEELSENEVGKNDELEDFIGFDDDFSALDDLDY